MSNEGQLLGIDGTQFLGFVCLRSVFDDKLGLSLDFNSIQGNIYVIVTHPRLFI